jgi:hypothetical protein
MDIARHLNQITLLVDYKGLVTPLEEMATGIVQSIEELGVLGIEALHDGGEVGSLGLNEKMGIMSQKAIGVDREAMTLLTSTQEGEKAAPVLIGEKKVLAVVALQDDVVAGPGKLYAFGSSHGVFFRAGMGHWQSWGS